MSASADYEIKHAGAALPTDPAERKSTPIATGVLDYFPLAIAEVARVSKIGNDQHNLGQPMHWAKEKSTDHADCIARHLIDRGTLDKDGMRHSAKVAWRALALLQTELEAARDRALAELPEPAVVGPDDVRSLEELRRDVGRLYMDSRIPHSVAIPLRHRHMGKSSIHHCEDRSALLAFETALKAFRAADTKKAA